MCRRSAERRRLAFDITDEAATAAAFAQIAGRQDILVNNAGMRDRRGLYAFTMNDVHRLFAANLVAPST
jgi:gluconate 5-dehydrogenase